eukprot:1975283-Amphidinium_carterae.1
MCRFGPYQLARWQAQSPSHRSAPATRTTCSTWWCHVQKGMPGISCMVRAPPKDPCSSGMELGIRTPEPSVPPTKT